jgi:hypothetical protein
MNHPLPTKSLALLMPPMLNQIWPTPVLRPGGRHRFQAPLGACAAVGRPPIGSSVTLVLTLKFTQKFHVLTPANG